MDEYDDDVYSVRVIEESAEVERLADRLLDQLIGFRGGCAECQNQAEAEHREQFQQHISLTAYLDSTTDLCPDILGTDHIATREEDLAYQMTPADRRRIYCGLEGDNQAPHTCLGADEPQSDHARVTFDIDSITGFADSIAVAKQGLRWHPSQMPVSDLQSSLHLRPQTVDFVDDRGRSYAVRRLVHQIPHHTLGRVFGFEHISLYLLFPHLYREDQGSARLRDVDFRLWMDGVLLPAIHQHYGSDYTQHYPSCHDHSRYNATARGVETRSQRVNPIACEQQLMNFLPPERLHQVWETILATIERPGYRQFADVQIFLHGKNVEVLTKDATWEAMMSRFQRYWKGAIEEGYITSNFYYDVGKEICPPLASQVAVCPFESENGGSGPAVPAETLVWKRCCLEACSGLLRQRLPQDTLKQVFYPLSMLHDSGSLTIEPRLSRAWRHDSLPYSQLYSSVKGVAISRFLIIALLIFLLIIIL